MEPILKEICKRRSPKDASRSFSANNHAKERKDNWVMTFDKHYEISFVGCYVKIQCWAAMSSYMSRTTS
jgi:hypothetical protein